MFETSNARGVNATQVNILKNFIFERAPKHAQIIYSHWISMLSVMELQGDDNLLLTYIRHLWVSINGPTTTDELGVSIEGKVLNEGEALSLVSTFDFCGWRLCCNPQSNSEPLLGGDWIRATLA